MSEDLDFGSTLRGYSPGQQVFGRYTLKRILGRGGMGVVWLASDDELEREVALKFLPEVVALDKQAIRDLKRETRRSLELTHSHIVRIYDFVQDGTKEAAAISMEYVAGDTLASRKVDAPKGRFEVAEIQDWVRQLCEALDYAHTKAKVVHRDLKPANLMADAEGDLRITDFGIAASVSDSVSRVSAHAGSSGTPVYMSPQQMMGEDPAVTDDVYSLGATLYDLLTGKPPFHSGNVIAQVQSKVPPSLTERREKLDTQGEPIPAVWEETIAACLAKNPADRPASAGAVWARLRGASSEPLPVVTKPDEVETPTLASEANPEAAPPIHEEERGASEPALGTGPKHAKVVAILTWVALGGAWLGFANALMTFPYTKWVLSDIWDRTVFIGDGSAWANDSVWWIHYLLFPAYLLLVFRRWWAPIGLILPPVMGIASFATLEHVPALQLALMFFQPLAWSVVAVGWWRVSRANSGLIPTRSLSLKASFRIAGGILSTLLVIAVLQGANSENLRILTLLIESCAFCLGFLAPVVIGLRFRDGWACLFGYMSVSLFQTFIVSYDRTVVQIEYLAFYSQLRAFWWVSLICLMLSIVGYAMWSRSLTKFSSATEGKEATV